MSSSLVDITTKSKAEGSASAHDDGVGDAKNGKERAFEIVVQRHLRKTLSVASGFARVQEDAEDIARQSLQKAFVHLRTFEGKSSFSAGLTRIAINESRMFLRRGRGQRKLSINEESADLKVVAQRREIPDSNPDREATYLQQEEARIGFSSTGSTEDRGHRRK